MASEVVLLSAEVQRISDKPGHDSFTVRFRLDGPEGSRFTAWRLRLDGLTRNAGQDLGKAGLVTGLDRIGTTRLLSVPAGTVIEREVTYARVGGPDRTVPVTIHAHNDEDGWV